MEKRSILISILIIFILVISLGLIITVQEFAKSYNEKNVVETEQVLLDSQQNNLGGLSGLSSLDNGREDDDNDIFESLSLSSSGGGGGGGSFSSKKNSKKADNSDVVNEETNSSENLDTINNETDFSGEDFEINFSENFTEEEIATNTSKSLEGIEVKSIIDSSVIWFTKAPPSDICYNFDESIDTISLGLGTVNLKWSIFNSDYISCVFNGQKDVQVKYCLMEDDPLYDDVIKCGYGTATTYNCNTLNLENYRGFIVKRKFTNVRLSSQFDEFGEGDRIEVYAEVSNLNNYFDLYATSNYYVYKKICDCLSGPCCYLPTNEFKVSESQPTGYTDSYYCDVVNSPTSTNHVIKRDWFCNGVSASAKYSDYNYDTCGTCEYCTSGDATCNYYGTSTSCGTKDCDYLDRTCRNYHDVNKYCSGGSCFSLSCNSYTNANKGTVCGTNKECDDYGNCVGCISHDYSQCYDNDVYWFDSCDNREEKKLPDCGTSSCNSWSDYCKLDIYNLKYDIYKKRTCYDKGCSSSACFSNSRIEDEFVQDCGDNDCFLGVCQFPCDSNSDCGDNGWIGSPYCKDNYKDLYQLYRYYKCNNPGTIQSSCTHTDNELKKETCEYGCENGKCKPEPGVECYNNSYCGIDGWTGSPFCFLKGVWQSYTNYYCRNPGTTSSYCESSYMNIPKEECGVDEYSDNYCYDDDVYRDFIDRGCSSGFCFEKPLVKQIVQDCGSDYCEGWQSNYCKEGDVYHKRICHDRGCSDEVCYDNLNIEEQKVQDCSNGCSGGSCNAPPESECIEVCTLTGCYEYCK